MQKRKVISIFLVVLLTVGMFISAVAEPAQNVVQSNETGTITVYARCGCGSPIENAAVVLYTRDGERAAEPSFTQQDGSIILWDIPLYGNYVIKVYASGFFPSREYEIGGDATIFASLQPLTEDDISFVVLVTWRAWLWPGAVVEMLDTSGRVAGIAVADEDGYVVFFGVSGGPTFLINGLPAQTYFGMPGDFWNSPYANVLLRTG